MSRTDSRVTSPWPTLPDRVASTGCALSWRGERGSASFRQRRQGAIQLITGQATRMATEPRTPLGVLLSAAERALAAELEEGLRSAGYHDLRAAHAQVFAAIAADGSRLTDLAGRAGMTKQAMGELVRYLEQHDYLDVEPDTRDRRAKLIRPTVVGHRARELSVTLVVDSDRRLAERIGEG